MPILLLSAIFANVFTIGFVWFDIYLWREWYLHKDLVQPEYGQEYAQHCLIGAIAILVLFALGKIVIRSLFSGSGKGMQDEPVAERYPEQYQLQRPDGSIINIEQGGVKGKQAIIFIHGWNSNSMQWYYQKKYFEKDYHLILMDHAGLGKSKRPDNRDYSLEKLAADLNAVIDYSNVNQSISIGLLCVEIINRSCVPATYLRRFASAKFQLALGAIFTLVRTGPSILSILISTMPPADALPCTITFFSF